MEASSRHTEFRLKQFSIVNKESAMKVGTDGILLGAWCSLSVTDSQALDVGCGTGIISLMLAQRLPQLNVVGIDIDPVSAAEASANVLQSAFASRVTILTGDFLTTDFACAADSVNGENFDRIVSNPPFYNEHTLSPDPRRARARNELSLPLPNLLSRSRQLLSPAGSLAIIAPAQRDDEVLFEAQLARMFPRRCCRVSTVEGKLPARTLWEFSPSDGPMESSSLTIRNCRGDFTEEYRALTRDFYLNL